MKRARPTRSASRSAAKAIAKVSKAINDDNLAVKEEDSEADVNMEEHSSSDDDDAPSEAPTSASENSSASEPELSDDTSSRSKKRARTTIRKSPTTSKKKGGVSDASKGLSLDAVLAKTARTYEDPLATPASEVLPVGTAPSSLFTEVEPPVAPTNSSIAPTFVPTAASRSPQVISIHSARVHNLKDVSVDVPKHRLVTFTGLSGSGKSSLVKGTIYAEAYRQLIGTFSTYARSRLASVDRPDCDAITGLGTSIMIDQKRLGTTPRSTVGTITEAFTYLRLLYARAGEPRLDGAWNFSFNGAGACGTCFGVGECAAAVEHRFYNADRSILDGGIVHPDFGIKSWYLSPLLKFKDYLPLKKPIGKFTKEEMHKLLYAEKAQIGEKEEGTFVMQWEGIITSVVRRYKNRDASRGDLSAKTIARSYTPFFEETLCPDCKGGRLNERAANVKFGGRTLIDITTAELTDVRDWLAEQPRGDEDPGAIPLRAALQVVDALVGIGLGYLNLSRQVSTLSGGESQRLKIARQLGCALVDIMYILDEPSIGLHPYDIDSLIALLKRLRDAGNSVLVVEHDPAVIAASDHVIELGPGHGDSGGELVFSGTVDELVASDTATSRLLRTRGLSIPVPDERQRPSGWYKMRNVNRFNLINFNVDLPTGVLVALTGRAGSGKSTLVDRLVAQIKHEKGSVLMVDQTPLGRTTRGNLLTYTGALDGVRQAFSKASGKPPGLFTFNSSGACEGCGGSGVLTVEMAFMESAATECKECHGTRFKEEVKQHKIRGASIVDVLDMSVEAAALFFENVPAVSRKLQSLLSVGLGYLRVGQSLSSLSGGESQRLRLGSELAKPEADWLILDEPTTGLAMADVAVLVDVLHKMVETGAGERTVLVVEHNLDVIAASDYVVDLGPDGGSGGGRLVAQGTPEQIVEVEASYTGAYLKALLHGSELDRAAVAAAVQTIKIEPGTVPTTTATTTTSGANGKSKRRRK